jgi:hypothetical protein
MLSSGGGAVNPFAALFATAGDVFVPIPGYSKMWQNTAKTTAAAASGDPVRVLEGMMGRVELTAPTDAARPTLTNSGDSWYLQLAGAQWLTGSYAQSAFPLMMAAFFTSGTVNAQGVFSLSAGATNDYHSITSYTTDLPRFWARGGGTLNSVNFRVAAASPYIALANYASADLDLYTDDQAVIEYTPANPFGTQTALNIGALASDGRGPFNARVYAAAIRPTLMSSDERLSLRTLWRDQQGL